MSQKGLFFMKGYIMRTLINTLNPYSYELLDNFKDLKEKYPNVAKLLEERYDTNKSWANSQIYLFPNYSDYALYELKSGMYYHYDHELDEEFFDTNPFNFINYAKFGRQLVKLRLNYDITINVKTNTIIHVTIPFKEI